MAENTIAENREAIATLTAQCKRDADEIAALKKRVAELEGLLKQANGSKHAL